MNNKKKGIATVLIGLFSVSCMAQGEDDAPQGFVYSTYQTCDVATQEQLDGVIEQYDKPVMDKAVEDGRMTGWGYYAHMTGGHWRRLRYHTAPMLNKLVEDGKLVGWGWLGHRVGGKYRRLQTLVGASHAEVLAARDAVGNQTGGPYGGKFGEICGSHTDYLWDIVH